MTKLEEAQKEYIGFIGDYLSGISVFLHVHGMGATEKQIEKGKRLRDNIMSAQSTRS